MSRAKISRCTFSTVGIKKKNENACGCNWVTASQTMDSKVREEKKKKTANGTEQAIRIPGLSEAIEPQCTGGFLHPTIVHAIWVTDAMRQFARDACMSGFDRHYNHPRGL